jgi:hypothetical protein
VTHKNATNGNKPVGHYWRFCAKTKIFCLLLIAHGTKGIIPLMARCMVALTMA